MVDCIPPPRRPPHEQHARPTDARHEPLLRSGPTPARLAGGLPIALSCLGLVVQLHALAPGGGGGKPRLTFPTKVLSDSLGRIGSLKRTRDKSLFPMALGSCGHRITHQLRPINMNGRSILSETSRLALFRCSATAIFRTQLYSM